MTRSNAEGFSCQLLLSIPHRKINTVCSSEMVAEIFLYVLQAFYHSLSLFFSNVQQFLWAKCSASVLSVNFWCNVSPQILLASPTEIIRCWDISLQLASLSPLHVARWSLNRHSFDIARHLKMNKKHYKYSVFNHLEVTKLLHHPAKTKQVMIT